MKTECLDTELSVLFSLFRFGKSALKEIESIGTKPEYFSNLIHREVYIELCNVLNNVESVSLSAFFTHYKNNLKRLDKDLIKIETCLKAIKLHPCTLLDIKTYIPDLRKYYCIRTVLAKISSKIDNLDVDFEPSITDIQKTLDIVKKEINPLQVRRVMGLQEGLAERIQHVKDVRNQPDKLGLIETGLINIDKYIGRQSGGDFVIYNAKTNMGKSMFMAHTAVHNWVKGRKVIVITIEMSSSQWLFRMDSKLSKIAHKEFHMGTISDTSELMTKWSNAITNINNPHDLLCYWVPSDCTIQKVRSIIENNPFKPDLVVVDYAGDMKSNLYGKSDFEAAAQAEIYSGLKEIAGDYDIVLYSAQQVRRDVKRIDSESGALTQVAANKADMIIAIECTKEDEDFITEHNGIIYNGRLSLSIVKGRNIPKCKTQIIPNFTKMDFIEKEFDEMMSVGFTSIKSQKALNQEKMEQLEKKLDNPEINQNDFDENEIILLD